MTRFNHHVRLGRLAASALLACLATALLAASAPAKPTSTENMRTVALQKGVNALIAAGIPGAILLARDGNHTVRLTGGLGDIGNKTPMNARNHFKIASLTKTYTATVVLQLVGEGKLHLSDSVEQWLPGLVPNGKHITLRQLLNHVSGLADFESDPRYLKPYLSGNLGFYWAPRQLVKIAVSHKPLFPPGVTKHTSYSNTNYVLLGLVVEAATHHSIGAELRNRIFRPCNWTQAATRRGSPVCRAPTHMATWLSASRRRWTSPASARRSRRPPVRSSPPQTTSSTSTARCSPAASCRPTC